LLETIEINGQILSPDEYEVIVIDNKTVGIKIDQDYLRGLDVGDYKIKVTFVNGEAESKLNVKDGDPNKPKEEKDNKEDVKGEVENPKTGLFNYLLLLIPLAIAGIIYIKVRKNTIYKNI